MQYIKDDVPNKNNWTIGSVLELVPEIALTALTERMNRDEDTAPKTDDIAASMTGVVQLWSFIQVLPLLQIKPPEAER